MNTNHYNGLRHYIFVESKLQIYTEKYTKYVIGGLVGIKGKSESDVANYILKEWIGDHLDELKEYGISVKNAKNERKL